MNSYFPPSFRYSLHLLLLYLLLIFPVSALLPYRFAFENGPIENIQAAILLGGALLCVCFFRISHPGIRGMWLAVSGLFLLLALRELSWGRVFFVERYTADGPVILPAVEMPFYWEIHIAAGLLAAACLYGLIRCTPWRQIFHEFPLPRFHLVLLILCLILVTLGDHHMMYRTLRDQTIEELAELLMYCTLCHTAWYYHLLIRKR